jgi:hypothetical protein
MTSERVINHPSAFLPIVMSLGALTAVGLHLALVGTAPQPDEGAAAHVWQLLMGLQLPVIFYFAARWVSAAPRRAVPILVLQIGAAVIAAAPVFLLHW